MAASLNRVILIGNLTADPELKHTPSATARTWFSIAVQRPQAIPHGPHFGMGRMTNHQNNNFPDIESQGLLNPDEFQCCGKDADDCDRCDLRAECPYFNS